MEGKTVQVAEFGTFRLKHLGRRINYNMFDPDTPSVSEEHLKISFMALTDLKRRAERKLKRQKAREESNESSSVHGDA